jgi:hypothetical protein
MNLINRMQVDEAVPSIKAIQAAGATQTILLRCTFMELK